MARKVAITGLKAGSLRLKPRRSRALIRHFHTSLKRLHQAKANNDRAAMQEAAAALEQMGGLDRYQKASISGQLADRGGDASRQLVAWLRRDLLQRVPTEGRSMLDVGCLRIDNACARSGIFSRIDRIDLNPQDAQIQKQDIMDRPLPRSKNELYWIVSLSLVVNFVPVAAARGAMLAYARHFIVDHGYLFLVLPSPCVDNSRYCTQDSIRIIFHSLGYAPAQFKRTAKLVYYLLEKLPHAPYYACPRRLLVDKPGRNNFCITLKACQDADNRQL